MKVLIVMPHSVGNADSGDRSRTKSLILGLQEKGIEPTLVFPVFGTDSQASDVGCPVVRLDLAQYSISKVLWRLSLSVRRTWNPFAIFDDDRLSDALDEVVRDLSPDLVDFQHSFMSRDVGVPSICTFHNIESRSSARSLNRMQRWVVRRSEKSAVHRSDLSVVFSQEDQDSLGSIAGGLGRIAMVRLGHGDAVSSREYRSELTTVGFVGSFDYAPNIWAARWLVENWSVFQRDAAVSRLVLVGRSANSLAISGAGIDVRSDVTNVADALSDVDVLVVPLRGGGGVRVKIIEAMALGLPIVSTRVGCEGLGLTCGVDAIVVDDVDGLVDGLRLVKDSSVRQGLAAMALAKWMSEFSPARMSSEMAELYLDVLDN